MWESLEIEMKLLSSLDHMKVSFQAIERVQEVRVLLISQLKSQYLLLSACGLSVKHHLDIQLLIVVLSLWGSYLYQDGTVVNCFVKFKTIIVYVTIQII